MKICVHAKDLFTNIHSNFSPNNPKLKIAQMFNETVVKQIAAHPNKGIVLRNKKECTLGAYNSMDESQRHYPELKKPDTKAHVLHDSIYVVFKKKQN